MALSAAIIFRMRPMSISAAPALQGRLFREGSLRLAANGPRPRLEALGPVGHGLGIFSGVGWLTCQELGPRHLSSRRPCSAETSRSEIATQKAQNRRPVTAQVILPISRMQTGRCESAAGGGRAS